MIDRLPSRHQVVRVRPVTFAYTRPLSAADVSGMTARLVALEATPARRQNPFQEALGKVRGFFKA